MSANKYFVIMEGLRGCYMPDSCAYVAMKTRRELKSYLESQADMIAQAGYIGVGKRRVAQFAALCWKHCASESLPFALGYGERGKSKSFGIMVGRASRSEYLEYCKESE